MIIDEHRHIGYACSRPERTAEDILRELDKLGVDYAVLAPGEPRQGSMSHETEVTEDLDIFRIGEECLKTGIVTPEVELLRSQPVNHQEVMEAVCTSGNRLLGCWFMNPWLIDKTFGEAKSAIRENGFRYIKLHPPKHLFAADDESVMSPVMELAAEMNVPVWFHCSYGPGSNFERVAKIASRFPGVNVIMGHVLCGDIEPDAVLKVGQAASSHKNLWIDLAESPLPYLQRVLKCAPIDRLLMSSDDPWGIPFEDMGLAAMMDKIRLATQGNEKLRRRVMGENAAKLLKLK